MPCYIFRAGDTDMVKIGWAARDVEARRAQLQSGTWEVLRVVRIVPAETSATETWFHRHFRAHRVARDWFRFVPEMLTIEPPRLAAKPRAGSSVDHIVAAFGGQNAMKRATGFAQQTISHWVSSGAIPQKHWAKIVVSAAALEPSVALTAHDFVDIAQAAA